MWIIKKRFNMKKMFLFLLILIILINACQSKTNESKKSTKTLSDMQITACNAAHEAGTCDTRLPELGIVLKEDCCQALGKCC